MPDQQQSCGQAFRFTIDDPAERDVVDAIGTPNAFNPGPPLYDPVRQILVHYDTIGRQVAAHAYGGPGVLDLLWTLPFCNTVQVRRFCPKISSEIEPVRAASGHTSHCELDPAVRLNAVFCVDDAVPGHGGAGAGGLTACAH